MGSVLAVYHHKIDGVFREHGGHDFFRSRTPRFAHNVTQKKKTDHLSFL
jgi:hypothetical protein